MGCTRPRTAVVVTAADGLGCAPLEVALAWIRDRPGVGGGNGVAELRQTLGALIGDRAGAGQPRARLCKFLR